jgi:hypothetical protein
MKNLTFSSKGLTKAQITFLKAVEKLYFEGVAISRDSMMLPAFNSCGFLKGSAQAKECLEAWSYWEFLPRPQYRETYFKPIALSELFNVNSKGYTILDNNWNSLSHEYVGKDLGMIDNDVYFKLIEDRLYCQYNRILGSRFVGYIINDLNFQTLKTA